MQIQSSQRLPFLASKYIWSCFNMVLLTQSVHSSGSLYLESKWMIRNDHIDFDARSGSLCDNCICIWSKVPFSNTQSIWLSHRSQKKDWSGQRHPHFSNCVVDGLRASAPPTSAPPLTVSSPVLPRLYFLPQRKTEEKTPRRIFVEMEHLVRYRERKIKRNSFSCLLF